MRYYISADIEGIVGVVSREHTGPQELRAAHPGRRPSHVSKHVGVVRVTPDGDRGQSECDGAPGTG